MRFKVDNGMMRLVFILQMIGVTVASGASKAPYPKSDRISGIVFERETLERRAEGSDIWSCTWGGNGEIYATYGDGGGFGGSDSKGRVSIGVAELKGEPTNWTGINLWGGFEPKSAQAAMKGRGRLQQWMSCCTVRERAGEMESVPFVEIGGLWNELEGQGMGVSGEPQGICFSRNYRVWEGAIVEQGRICLRNVRQFAVSRE